MRKMRGNAQKRDRKLTKMRQILYTCICVHTIHTLDLLDTYLYFFYYFGGADRKADNSRYIWKINKCFTILCKHKFMFTYLGHVNSVLFYIQHFTL